MYILLKDKISFQKLLPCMGSFFIPVEVLLFSESAFQLVTDDSVGGYSEGEVGIGRLSGCGGIGAGG
jgi:hypothetical protein